MSLFDTLLDSPIKSTLDYSGSPTIISEQHDRSQITWQNGAFDIHEMNGQTGVAAGLRRANLAMTNGKINFFSARKTPWHGLGTVIDRNATRKEMMQVAYLSGWSLKKVQHFLDLGGVAAPVNAWSIVRGDNNAVLADYVGSRYTIYTNEQTSELVDSIVHEGHAHYETAGALGKGEVVWFLAKLPNPIKIADKEELDSYLLATTTHDGSGTIRVATTTSRPECQNTLNIALKGIRGKGVSIKHTANAKDRAKIATNAIQLSQQAADEFSVKASTLATSAMPDPRKYFAAYLDSALTTEIAGIRATGENMNDGSLLAALNAMPSYKERNAEKEKLERARDRRREFITDILNRYESDRNNGKENIKGTAWAALQAVSEQIDHSPLYRANKEAESRFERVLIGAGDDLKQEAFTRALQAV